MCVKITVKIFKLTLHVQNLLSNKLKFMLICVNINAKCTKTDTRCSTINIKCTKIHVTHAKIHHVYHRVQPLRH